MKRFLDRLSATHASEHIYRRHYAVRRQKVSTTNFLARAPHPVVRTHSLTGHQAFFMHSVLTIWINQFSEKKVMPYLKCHLKTRKAFKFSFDFTSQKNVDF